MLQQIRDIHRETDKYIVNTISKRYNVLDTKVKLLIPPLLDMDTNALNKMKKLCCNGWAQREVDSVKNVIIGFEDVGSNCIFVDFYIHMKSHFINEHILCVIK